MAINKTEKLARAWLSETYNVPMDSITFSPSKTPDFVLPDGQAFEIKRLYGDKIIVYSSQIKALEKDIGCTVLVFRSGSKEPVAKIPAVELLSAVNYTKTWQNIKIVVPGQMRAQVVIDPSIRARVDRMLEDKHDDAGLGLPEIVREALISYLESRGF